MHHPPRPGGGTPAAGAVQPRHPALHRGAGRRGAGGGPGALPDQPLSHSARQRRAPGARLPGGRARLRPGGAGGVGSRPSLPAAGAGDPGRLPQPAPRGRRAAARRGAADAAA